MTFPNVRETSSTVLSSGNTPVIFTAEVGELIVCLVACSASTGRFDFTSGDWTFHGKQPNRSTLGWTALYSTRATTRWPTYNTSIANSVKLIHAYVTNAEEIIGISNSPAFGESDNPPALTLQLQGNVINPDILWLAYRASYNTVSDTAIPDNYTLLIRDETQVSATLTQRELATNSEDPGPFTNPSAFSSTWTIAVLPTGVKAVPTPIKFQNSAFGTNTATMPAHRPGDLLLAWGYRDGSIAVTTPSDSGWIPVRNVSGASSNVGSLYKRIATTSNHTSGTFQNATTVIIAVYRPGEGYTLDVGASNGAMSSGTTVQFPALSLQKTDGTSWVVGFVGHRSNNVTIETPPTGMINRVAASDSVDENAFHDTNGPVSVWPNNNVAVGGTASGWMTAVAEIKVSKQVPQQTATFKITNTMDDATDSWDGSFTDSYLVNGDAGYVDENSGGVLNFAGIRFRDITIPKNSKIVSANLKITVDYYLGGPTFGRLFGVSSDNAPVWSNPSNLPSEAVTFGAGMTIYPSDNYDVTQVVQTIINRSGWSSGNALAFVTDGSSEAYIVWWDSSGQAMFTPTLTVTYEAADAPPGDTTPPTITSSSTHSVNENASYSATATANETVTWTKGGTDQAIVTLNATTGAWSVPAQNYESKPVVSFTLTATDTAGNATTQTITVNIIDVDEIAPVITSAATGTVEEGNLFTVNLTANESVTWSKISGTASLSGTSLTYGSALAPGTYETVVSATDAVGNYSQQTHTLTITARVVSNNPFANYTSNPTNIIPAPASTQLSGNGWAHRTTTPVLDTTVKNPIGRTGAYKYINVGQKGQDHYILASAPNGSLLFPSFFIKRVSTSGQLAFGNPYTTQSGGQWRIDLSLLDDEWNFIKAGHPAIIQDVPWMIAGGGGGMQIWAETGSSLSFYLDHVEVGTAAHSFEPSTVPQPTARSARTAYWF